MKLEKNQIQRVRESLERHTGKNVESLSLYDARQIGRHFMKAAYHAEGCNFEAYALLDVPWPGTIKWLSDKGVAVDELENFVLALTQPDWAPIS